MKKALFLLLALVLMLAAVACQIQPQPPVEPPAESQPAESPSGEPAQPTKQPQSSEDIQMTVKEQTVAGDVESVTLTITNASDKQYTYGVMSSVEAEKNGAWEQVEPVDTLMWIEIAYIIEPGQQNEEAVTINEHYGTLAPGNYRIVKTFTDPDGNGITAYGQFTVQ